MCVSIAQLVDVLHANEPITVPVPPKTFVLGLVPFRMITETDAEWVVAAVSGWDDTVDMSPFCLDHAQCTEYLVKAVVYHVHPLEGPANLRCGHYITYFKHGDRWHLANDSQVDPVLMTGLRGLPYIVLMERTNVLEGFCFGILRRSSSGLEQSRGAMHLTKSNSRNTDAKNLSTKKL